MIIAYFSTKIHPFHTVSSVGNKRSSEGRAKIWGQGFLPKSTPWHILLSSFLFVQFLLTCCPGLNGFCISTFGEISLSLLFILTPFCFFDSGSSFQAMATQDPSLTVSPGGTVTLTCCSSTGAVTNDRILIYNTNYRHSWIPSWGQSCPDPLRGPA
jgi:hypothetical protein